MDSRRTAGVPPDDGVKLLSVELNDAPNLVYHICHLINGIRMKKL